MLLQLYTKSLDAQVSDNQLKQDLLKLEQALVIGIKTHDTTALKNIIANEYQLSVAILDDTLVGPKFLQAVRREQWLPNCFQWSFDSAALTQISVSSWGEVAVFRSLQHFYNLMIGNSQPPFTGALVTDLWLKRDKRWQLVTRLSERLPKK
ncbi:MAG: hypothetical protein C5B59_13305 [Bacteroidetes bacterium]|nr:MAG: hypothetical protein C5B59_13305 [Bacteroidota bacterium]